MQVTFHPGIPGNYEAVLWVYANMMTGSGHGQEAPIACQSLVLKSVAEHPQVELSTTGSADRALDFGVLVGGATVAMSLELINRGQSKVPLKLSITSDVSKSRVLYSKKVS